MATWYYISSDELYHHGIKGMRWGVRRFQKKDGTLTSAGKKRYADDPTESSVTKQKSKHRLKLEEKYRSKGMSQEDAELAASRRIKTERLLAVVGGVTVAAVAAYGVNKYVKERTDQVLKEGHLLQRIEMQNTQGKLYDKFYASANKSDNARYKAILGKTRLSETGEAYIMSIATKKDVKVASRQNVQKIFDDLMQNDSEFRDMIDNRLRLKGEKNNKLKYDKFNINLALLNRTEDQSGFKEEGATVKKFYSALRDKGYSAIQDINDMKYSTYNAKNPLIIFDAKENVMVKSFSELSKEEATKNYGREYTKMMIENFAPTVTAYGAGTAAALYALNTIQVNKYRQEHPNSGMSDKEIIKMLDKQRKNR